MTQAAQRPYLDDEEYAFPTPSIDRTTPSTVRRGDTVTVKGANLASVDRCIIRIGQDTRRGEIAQTAEENQVKVRVPLDLPLGTGRISLANATGESNRLEVTVQP